MNFAREFIEHGYTELGSIFSDISCAKILEAVHNSRQFDESLFFDEAEFNRLNPDAFNKNPRPGCNILEGLQEELESAERNSKLVSLLTELLGPGYNIFRKKVVCGMPEVKLPNWISDRVSGMPSNNLAHFVKPEFTDITYFYGIDFHQDIVDWKDRRSDFLTVYVYLDDVGETDAPLFVVPDSQLLGASCFPHDLEPLDASNSVWRYRSDDGKLMEVRHHVMTGKAGHVACWHPLMLHGTEPDLNDHPRLSLRYLIERDPDGGPYGIDIANDLIDGPLETPEPRKDLDQRGLAVVRNNRLYEHSRTAH
jgi:hypothetical protein